MKVCHTWVVGSCFSVAVLLFSLLATAETSKTPLSVLLDYSRSPSYKVRAQAALVFGTMPTGDLKVLNALTRLVYDKHRVVRASAVMALGKFDDVRSLGALSDALHDDDIRVARLAARATGRLVRSFRHHRLGFSERHWNIRIKHLGKDARFKDHVMQELLEYDNIDIGSAIPFEEDTPGSQWPIELDLRGRFLSMTSSKASLSLTLAFQHGGHVVKELRPIRVRGKTVDAMLKRAAEMTVKRLLKFLGGA